MILKLWEELPDYMKCPEVRTYYDTLKKRTGSLLLKRLFDVVIATLMLTALLPIILIISICIKFDSKGPVLFKQTRITTYGREFKIWKFRSMVDDAEEGNGQLTTSDNIGVTRIGKHLRNSRLDELPQLVNIIKGDMSFVGTRPEVSRYVKQYKPEMLATLLLPAGVTSEASILYKNEYRLLENAEDAGKVYVDRILPGKMYYNLKSIENFSFWAEINTMLRTVLAVLGKEYEGDYVEPVKE